MAVTTKPMPSKLFDDLELAGISVTLADATSPAVVILRQRFVSGFLSWPSLHGTKPSALAIDLHRY